MGRGARAVAPLLAVPMPVPSRRMSLLVLQHIACEPPAAFEDELRSRGLDLVRVELDEGDAAARLARVRRTDRDGRADGRLRGRRAPLARGGEAHAARGDRGRAPGLGRVPRSAAAGRGARRPRLSGPRARGRPARRRADRGRGRRPGVRRRRRGASPPSSGMATPSTCPPAPRCWPARPPTATRRSRTGAPTRCSSTSRCRPSWPRAGARSRRTRRASRRSRARGRSSGSSAR